MPGLSLQDADDEEALVRQIQTWAAARRKRYVLIVFDQGIIAGKSARLSNNRVQVFFAPAGQTADSLLVRRINQVQNPPEHTLVSSDRAIISAAAERGMPYIFAEVFAAQMEEERQPPPPEPEQPTLSDAEVAQWMALFGPVPERPPRPPRRRRPEPEAPPDAPPPPPRAYSAAEYKAGTADMSADELAEWLALFGPEPEPALDKHPRAKKTPPHSAADTSAPGGSLHVDDEKKEGRARLTPEEMEMWLNEFGGEDPRQKR